VLPNRTAAAEALHSCPRKAAWPCYAIQNDLVMSRQTCKGMKSIVGKANARGR
jgi:hypothetical protein